VLHYILTFILNKKIKKLKKKAKEKTYIEHVIK